MKFFSFDCKFSASLCQIFVSDRDVCVSDDVSCAKNPCDNGGQCQEAVNTITCTCPAGISGEFCSSNRSNSLFFTAIGDM